MLDLDRLPEPDIRSGSRVAERAANLLRPRGALARLDEIAVWLAEWQRSERPAVEAPVGLVFFADHGVAADGVSAYPATVTRAMLDAMRAGVATVSAMARSLGVEVYGIDVGVGDPTGNIRVESAMAPGRFTDALEAGRAAVRSVESDLLVLGEMGIGNTTPAAAMSAALFGPPIERWVGAGSGVDGEALDHKRRVVAEAVARAALADPAKAWRELGGAELAALAGATLEARLRSIPVLVDGFVATAAMMPLELVRPGALDHCWPGHLSPEPGHRLLVERLGRRPILDLGMRLGEASGAMAALPVVRLASAAVRDTATFEEWGIG